MNTEQTSTSKREPGFYFVKDAYGTQTIAEWVKPKNGRAFWSRPGLAGVFDEDMKEIDERRIERPPVEQQTDRYAWVTKVLTTLDSVKDNPLTHASVFYNEKYNGLNIVISRYGTLWNWIIEDKDYSVDPELFANDLIADTKPQQPDELTN